MSESLYAVALGVIQGLTEFLPVSSSGHLVIFSFLMDGKPLPLSLNVALHIGTLSAVILFYWRDWWALGLATMAKVFKGQSSFETSVLLPAILIGSIPAGVIGLLWKDVIETAFHDPIVVVLPLALVGILIWQADKRNPQNRALKDLTISHGLLIGIAQAVALVPGVSRSGITVMAARLLGYEREDAARFSFLLGTPAMGGAALLTLGDLTDNSTNQTFLIGCLVSCVVGCFAIKLFVSFIKRYGFGAFAAYRLGLAGILAYLFLAP